jgi:hypothetical protein
LVEFFNQIILLAWMGAAPPVFFKSLELLSLELHSLEELKQEMISFSKARVYGDSR